jgi:hypothetical protein
MFGSKKDEKSPVKPQKPQLNIGKILLDAKVINDGDQTNLVAQTDSKLMAFVSNKDKFPCLHIVATTAENYAQLDTLMSELENQNEDKLCAVHDISLPFNKKVQSSPQLNQCKDWIYTIPLTTFTTQMLKKSLALDNETKHHNEAAVLCKTLDSYREKLITKFQASLTIDAINTQIKALVAKYTTAENRNDVISNENDFDAAVTKKNMAEIGEMAEYLIDALGLKKESADYPIWLNNGKKIRQLNSAIMEIASSVKDMRGSLGEQQAALSKLCEDIGLPSAVILNDHGRFIPNDIYKNLVDLAGLRISVTEPNKIIEAVSHAEEQNQLHAHIKKMHQSRSDYIPLSFVTCNSDNLWDKIIQRKQKQCGAPTYTHQVDDGLAESIQKELKDLFHDAKDASGAGLPLIPLESDMMKLIGDNFQNKHDTLENEVFRFSTYGSRFTPLVLLEARQLGIKYINEGGVPPEINDLFGLYRAANFQFIKEEPSTDKNKFIVIPRTMMEFASVLHTLQNVESLQKDLVFKKNVVEKFLPKFKQDIAKGIYTVLPDKFLAMAKEVYEKHPGKLVEITALEEAMSKSKSDAMQKCRNDLFNKLKVHINTGGYMGDPDPTHLFSTKTGMFVETPKNTAAALKQFVLQMANGEDFTLENLEKFQTQPRETPTANPN